MKLPTLVSFGFFLIGMLVFLAQLWFQVFSPEMLVKIMITDGAFFVISIVVAFLIKENRETDKINKGSGLD